jgi:hypothetical protein
MSYFFCVSDLYQETYLIVIRKYIESDLVSAMGCHNLNCIIYLIFVHYNKTLHKVALLYIGWINDKNFKKNDLH